MCTFLHGWAEQQLSPAGLRSKKGKFNLFSVVVTQSQTKYDRFHFEKSQKDHREIISAELCNLALRSLAQKIYR